MAKSTTYVPATKERLEVESGRYETLIETYNAFFEELVSPEHKDKIHLNKFLLSCVIRSYFDDIERFKSYSGSDYADNHKQAAYTIKWISRFKPIQFNADIEEINFELLNINSFFAIFAGFSMFLDNRLMNLISPEFMEHLIYTTQYRHISGKQLATSLFLMEKIAEGYYDANQEENNFSI